MNLQPIAHIHTCYGEKFGVPRQSGLVDDAWGKLVFEPAYRSPDAVRGLDGFSHVWLIFLFHQAVRENWKPTVRPPRLGGNEKVGVFASRAPFRPNPIGLSVVRLDSIDFSHPDSPILHLRGVDLVDGTPILDIKPYIPYADSIPDATSGFAPTAPNLLKVQWHPELNLSKLEPATQQLIENTLAVDPRPAYQKGNSENSRTYGCQICGYNIRWSVTENTLLIVSFDPIQ